MTTEREAAGPEEARGAADHESGTSSQLLWERTAVVTEDVNGTFQVLPGAGGDLLGWSNADLQCAPYVDFVHPDDRDLLAEAGDAQRLSSAPTAFVPLDLRVLARDRRYWWTRWSVVATGRGVGAVGVDYLAPHPTKGP
ncbi:MAG: PAS domain-containing protein, partial [Ilumatobacteraceae bacterium]